ncbi:MAG TPA: RNA ligase family protein, partial [Blastocatellia bacterium]|nr:RNA ligase family protein [Blastocatellia bacterium]
MSTIYKYPRTPHLNGSRYQPGDEDLASVAFETIKDRFVVIEEKVDGANAGISFTADGKILLQSRGHFLVGGGREKHFNLFKTWANCHQQELWDVLGDRYVLYGEWLYAKHTIFYDLLPHYFLEFDVLDNADGTFLSTDKRAELLSGVPVTSVPVLWSGEAKDENLLKNLAGRSLYKSNNWLELLKQLSAESNAREDMTIAQ